MMLWIFLAYIKKKLNNTIKYNFIFCKFCNTNFAKMVQIYGFNLILKCLLLCTVCISYEMTDWQIERLTAMYGLQPASIVLATESTK